MVARIVVLAIPSQAPAQGVVRSQFSTERSWYKVSRFCYMLMKYSCDRRRFTTARGSIKRPWNNTNLQLVVSCAACVRRIVMLVGGQRS